MATDLLPTAEHILQRTSETAGEAPPPLEKGELATNLEDEILFIGKGAGKPPLAIRPGGTISLDAGEYH
jgi:hypothetical protein